MFRLSAICEKGDSVLGRQFYIPLSEWSCVVDKGIADIRTFINDPFCRNRFFFVADNMKPKSIINEKYAPKAIAKPKLPNIEGPNMREIYGIVANPNK